MFLQILQMKTYTNSITLQQTFPAFFDIITQKDKHDIIKLLQKSDTIQIYSFQSVNIENDYNDHLPAALFTETDMIKQKYLFEIKYPDGFICAKCGNSSHFNPN